MTSEEEEAFSSECEDPADQAGIDEAIGRIDGAIGSAGKTHRKRKRPAGDENRRKPRKGREPLRKRAKAPAPLGPPKPCFLCRFNHTQTARTLHTYMVDNASISIPEHMAQEMTAVLQKMHPGEEGTDQDACLQHLLVHSLHPSMKIAQMLRSLYQLSDQVAVKLNRDDEGVDNKDAETFVRVQNQILNVYKMPEVTRLFFADQHQGGGVNGPRHT